MNKLDISKTKSKPNPILKGLSTFLKDPKNFDEVEKKLLTVLKIEHGHKTASSYAKCKECDEKRLERQKLMRSIGFKSIGQYWEWKKIHTIIKNKSNFQVR